ncbi:MAG: beta-ketoacyl-[acyl-carrier-protein] synthase family protein [Candidatus Brocadiia bacterium]
MTGRCKVWVTGLGVVSCLGIGAEAFWNALLCCENGIGPLDRFDLGNSAYTFGGQVSGMTPEPFLEAGGSMGAQFAVRAAKEALDDVPETERKEMALILATNFGPAEILEQLIDEGDLEGAPIENPLPRGFYDWDVEYVANRIGLGGERFDMSLSCSSGNAAFGHALELIRGGCAEMVLAGGYDSIQKTSWAGLSCLRVMAVDDDEPPLVRPFDANRSGTLFSEGAALLLLESADHAKKRGAHALAELAGAGANNNAYHMTHADEEGKATGEVIRMAIEDSQIDDSEISHFNAHGTGTKLNDVIESRAIGRVFGDRTKSIPVNSLKGGLGHGMGAASAFEAVACVRSLQENLIPPTANLETPDPECDLDLVRNEPREADLKAVVNNSAGIGGGNAAVLLKKAGD